MKRLRLLSPLLLLLVLAGMAVPEGAAAPPAASPNPPTAGGQHAPHAAPAFRIGALTANNALVVDHDPVTGDDRGGIATSNTQLFYTGDNATARFSLDDLSGATSVGEVYNTLVGDLQSGQVYLLGHAGAPIPIQAGNQTVSELLEVDGDTGALTGSALSLTPAISLSTDFAGLFAGYGQIVLYDPNNGHVWSIALPSGQVEALPNAGGVNPHYCENWAFWGIAEHWGGQDSLVYRQSGSESIVRTRLSDGTTSTVAAFSSLSDMCSISGNVARGRWYFHHEGTSQFGGTSETAGYADAVFLTTAGALDGYIYDAQSGSPVEGARVTAGLYSELTNPYGYYTITLGAGTYTVVATHPHYTSAATPGVVIVDGSVTTLNLQLVPRGRLWGSVTDADSGAPLAATLTADDGSTTTSDPASGSYELYLDAGSYVVTATAWKHMPGSASVSIVSGAETREDYALPVNMALLPQPLHITLPWQGTGPLYETLANRTGAPYDFAWTEIDRGFTPLAGTLLPGDFTQLADSPVPLTCVAADPTTGLIYAQQNDGYGFYQYDPWAGTWTQLADCPLDAGNNGGAAYLDGRIYTAYTGQSDLGIYDIAGNSWSTRPSGLGYYGNIASDGDSLYLVGGYTLARYDPATDAWAYLAAPPFYFEPWGGLQHLGGVLYGHQGNGDAGFARYDIASDTWMDLPDVPGGAVLGSAIDPAARIYYAYGSYGGTNWYAYAIAGGSWSTVPIPFFSVEDGGMAYLGDAGISGIYFVQGENGPGLARMETLPWQSNVPWVGEDPTSGTVPAGVSFPITLLFSATYAAGIRQPGEYAAVLGTGGSPPYPFAVRMTVLPSPAMGKLEGTVRDICTGEAIAATADIAGGDPITATASGAAGEYQAWLFAGSYDLTWGAPGYLSTTVAVAITSGITTTRDVEMVPKTPCAVFTPSSFDVWLLSGTPVYTHPTGLHVANAGGGNLNMRFLEQPVIPFRSAGRPAGLGDFTQLADSPAALTCVTVDPTSGLIYAQENAGFGFYRYDPAADTWTQLADCPLDSGNNGGAAYLDGRIYTSYTGNDTLGIYDIAGGSWMTRTNAVGYTGNIASAGTFLYLVRATDLQRYDPTADAWTPLAAPPFYFESWGGLQHLDGVLYGHQGNGSPGFARYDIASNTWKDLPDVPGGAVLGSAIDPVERVYYAYGSYGDNHWYAFRIDGGSWRTLTIPFFSVEDGGMAYLGDAGSSGIYFVQGENGPGLARMETVPAGSDVAWFWEVPSPGMLPPGSDGRFALVFTAVPLPVGHYRALLYVFHNAPGTPDGVFEVTLHVIDHYSAYLPLVTRN